MIRRYFKSETERRRDRNRLNRLAEYILKQVPGCAVSSDQAYREADLAIDFCEDVPRLPQRDIDKIVRLFQKAGARSKVSSVHVNGWFGHYDKLSMTRCFLQEVFAVDSDLINDDLLFIGDSPNDCPMFGYFHHSVGVANLLEFKEQLTSTPAWITEKAGGYGFVEMVDILLSKKQKRS